MTAPAEAVTGQLVAASWSPLPGSRHPARHQPPAPGAVLDNEPWAASWSQFMKAITDERDSSARQFIASAMRARPQNATFSERIPAEGGFLVPERLRAEVLSYMTSAVIRPRALPVVMDSLTVPIPILDNPSQGSSAQALGGLTFAWTAQGAAITPSAATFGAVKLVANKLDALLQDVPNELISDAPAFSDVFLPATIGQGLAWVEDDAFVNGTGVGEPQGLLNAPCAITTDRVTSDSVGVGDIVSMYKQLAPQSKRSDNAVWLVSDGAFGQILDIATITGTNPAEAASGPSLWLEWDSQAGFWRLLGAPCFPSDHMPALGTTGDVLLADLSLFLVGDRQELTIELSQRGAGFPADSGNYRIKARLDGRYWLQSSITLENGSVVSPIVILSSAS
jgi:HK97 family phage major capsid protein